MWNNSFLILLSVLLRVEDTYATVDFIQAPPASDDPKIEVKEMLLHTPRQRDIKSFLTVISAPVGFVSALPSHPQGCTGRVRTSIIASEAGCAFAVNGGPFDMDTGACEGSLISDGKVFQIDDNSGFASWGLTKDGRWVFGDVSSLTVQKEQVTELLSGFIGGLLVRNSDTIVSSNALVAQRTAVGVDATGKLLFLTIDGAETRNKGMNITELSIAFRDLGATYALNLDGGGSTTAWKDGELIDRPTCRDGYLPECERPVANIVCVKGGV
jgi:exopolysaccharide biosynthesis protein